MEKERIKELSALAIKARKLAYVPYSNFAVGAVLISKDGTEYMGGNVENAAFSPTICAERSAFIRAIMDGKRAFSAIFVAGGPQDKGGDEPDFCAPCGVCRQTMREFCSPSDFKVFLVKSVDEVMEMSLGELLPLGFGPEDLGMKM